MVEISLCMIVKNEEDVLARCLESVQGIADEIIVVDTGSNDTTLHIAAQYATVYTFPWKDDFAAARNYSFSKATKDYILWLDADDIFLEEDRQKFRELKTSLTTETDMVMMKYNVAFDKDGNPTLSYYRERLLRRAMGYQWIGAVHEVIPQEGHIVYSDIAVTHRKLHPSDPDRNLRIFEKLLKEGETLDPRQEFYYGRELYYHSRWEEAARVFTAFLNEGRGWKENSISACMDLCRCLEKLGRREEALLTLFRSFLYDPPRAEVCCEIGRLFMERQEYTSAIYWYEAACQCNPEQAEASGAFVSPECYDFIPFMELCVCWDRLGDHQKAYSYHKKAQELRPESAGVQHNEVYFASHFPDLFHSQE